MMNDPSLHVRERRLWFAILGRGIVGLLVAALLMSTPSRTPRGIAGLLAIYLLADGALSLYASMRARRAGKPGGTLVVVAVIDGFAAALALAMPAVLALRVIGGLRAVASGACDVLWPRHQELSELLIMGGVAAIGLGAVVLGWPGPATIALPWLLGLEAMVSSSLLFAGAASELKSTAAAIVPQRA